tara:strand:+ start:3074 stop:3721 length:648 start_codon:yes stop_codon:yes gene_type:complete
MRILTALSLLTLALNPSANASPNASADHKHNGHSNKSKVFGNVEVHNGEQAGDVRSVNGNIRLEANSEVEKASTTNGGIRIDDNVKAQELSTVNGSIRAGEGLIVDAGVRTVNGDIRLKSGSRIGDSVITVNGSIQLTGSSVGEDVETLNGDIELRHSIVKGDVVFREKQHYGHHSPPTLVIDANSEVRGRIILRQEVELQIAEGARVGEIIQDT